MKIVSSANEMTAFGVNCAGCVAGGQVIFLDGDLGAGKTTFAAGLISGLGYFGLVTSPTFSLLESYALGAEPAKDLSVHHFDLYRLDEPDELEMIGARDLFNSQSICLIEWAEKARGFLPEPDLIFTINYHESGRQLDISGQAKETFIHCMQQRNNA